MTEAQRIEVLEAENKKLREALAKALTIMKTQERNLGTVGLSVIALAENLVK
jgi:hypothetical protein